ncbi:UDP-N-acetylenolpyruvoylglucosamine reductase [Candidatus Hydrogenisulfobacillus filiaventi]|uniref:UDP-N-acetylenolpyruvoylglucosamine reductase n=1 Tax=Candidatus Hydrogenisulfobacillus filiaventi TaxID=2707344 RepID=A0A6F8ZFB1_9FIRM|nr:UDP-N-acetylmuramate dehydrogenase [Bacillota bacterium]CAB1128467.1 UDP-N-acetylenolpyruvoylglucosamine reductase [Candidatus Hydrogenisulfobacillus filiaventi]
MAVGPGEAVTAPLVRDLRRLTDAVREAEPMARHTTFRIGGPADVYVEPEDRDRLVAVLDYLTARGVPYQVVGQGSNLLVADAGVRGVVVSPVKALRRLDFEGRRARAGAGVLLTQLAHAARRRALAGCEFAVAIPGTLGGGLFMNAGAHGSSLAAVVAAAEVWTPERGVVRLPAAELGLSYRHSRLWEAGWVVLEAWLELEPDSGEAITARMRHVVAVRRRTQPVGHPNAGSVFKNPPQDYAGRLIDAVGAKGWRVGGAEVSSLHANFINNRGGARAADVLCLMRRIRAAVHREYGVILRPEVRWVGPPAGGEGTTWENLWCREDAGWPEPCA